MTTMLTCPEETRLRAVLDGLMDEAVIRHLDDCEPCRNRLDQLAGGPQTWAAVKHLPDPTRSLNPTLHHSGSQSAALLAVGSVLADRYILMELLGEGGMGSVYRAEQSVPVKRAVALKLIKSGMDSKVVLARFDAERQALALMDHPNIARVYDGGTASGQPFFVMELVHGVPITQFCDEHRLPVRARLEIFVAVCQAVQHAHQKGIIHRDLKPGNILVTEVDGRPTPKVIDFGVAKATEIQLTDQSFADTGAIVGTPAYMSPEQADPSSMDIDTRTDVYALGVILYELLAGSPPIEAKQFQRGAVLEMLRMVREVEPPRPSTKLSTDDALPNIAANRDIDPGRLAKLLRGELDWVVMKAIEKDRTRRYETANSFAADLQRYLADEVVEARPPSPGYRLRKFVRRNRGGVIAAELAVFLTFAGTGLTAWQALRAQRAEVEANENARRAEVAKGEAELSTEKATNFAADAIRLAEQRRQELYASTIQSAWTHWDRGDLIRMREVLTGQIPGPGQTDLRGFEWHYLNRLESLGRGSLNAGGPIRALAVSRDGRWIATASPKTAEVLLWNVQSRLLERRFAMEKTVHAVAFSPDSQELAAASESGRILTWNPATGVAVRELTSPGPLTGCLEYSPDGSMLAAANGRWTIRPGNPFTRFTPAGYDKVAGRIWVWNAKSGEFIKEISTPVLLSCLAFSPNSERVAAGGFDGFLRIWDVKTGKQQSVAKSDQTAIFSVAYSPDGRTVVTSGWDRFVRLRDSQSGVLLREWRPSNDIVFSLRYSPDGKNLLTAGFDRFVRIWDTVAYKETGRFLGHTLTVASIAYSGDGKTLFSAGWDGNVNIWSGNQTQECERLNRDPLAKTLLASYHVCFSPDSKLLAATGAGRIVIYDTATRKELREITVPNDNDLTCAFRSDGKMLVAVGIAGIVRRYQTSDWSSLPDLKSHQEKIWSLAFSPDGRHLATGGGEASKPGEVRIWDSETGQLVYELTTSGNTVRCVCFDSTGEILQFPVGNKVFQRLQWRTGHVLEGRTGVYHVAKSADGNHEAVGAYHNGELTGVNLLNPDGSIKYRLRGHTLDIYQIVFTPDSKTLATASWDGSVRLWHVATGQELLTFQRQSGVAWSVGFSPDNSLMAIGAGTMGLTELTLWDAHRTDALK